MYRNTYQYISSASMLKCCWGGPCRIWKAPLPFLTLPYATLPYHSYPTLPYPDPALPCPTFLRPCLFLPCMPPTAHHFPHAFESTTHPFTSYCFFYAPCQQVSTYR